MMFVIAMAAKYNKILRSTIRYWITLGIIKAEPNITCCTT